MATSAPEAEFTASYDAIRYGMLAGAAGVLAVCLFFLIRAGSFGPSTGPGA